jgi:hypothetical protein
MNIHLWKTRLLLKIDGYSIWPLKEKSSVMSSFMMNTDK